MSRLRLSPIETKALASAVGELDAHVFVFGSRTSREARGGDVDILVVPRTDTFSDYRVSQQVTVAFQRVCDEKVDVVVLPRRMDEGQRAFFRSIKKVRVR
jgi:predicted nucleotidyltransferase